MRKTAVVTLILIGLMTLSVVCIQPIKAEYQGDITINADGSISPSTAPIQQNGDTYTLTGDAIGSITVLRSNMTFDGNGHSLIALGTGHGVEGLSVGCNYYSSPPVLTGASNVTVKNLTVKGSVFGISLVETTNALIFNNTISETKNIPFQATAGIRVSGGGSNTITGNYLVNNYVGIYCIETQNNLIVGNDVVNCSTPGGGGTAIAFWGASNNIIYHNSFINNEVQAYDDSFNSPFSVNTWDNGYPSGGNYWSDYKTKYPSAVQIGDSGVYNIPYSIDKQNIDRYPLTQPFNSEFYAPKIPPKIALLSPVNQVFNESSVPLFFTVDKQANWIGYSLDGQDNITITGNITIAGLSSGLHNVTVYAKDEFENMGASETISFSVAEEPEPFPAAPVLATAATLAIACIAILVYFKKRRATNLKRNNEI
jgi:parallel beta-helix repeat protein